VNPQVCYILKAEERNLCLDTAASIGNLMKLIETQEKNIKMLTKPSGYGMIKMFPFGLYVISCAFMGIIGCALNKSVYPDNAKLSDFLSVILVVLLAIVMRVNGSFNVCGFEVVSIFPYLCPAFGCLFASSLVRTEILQCIKKRISK
jgi:hypothetical protein